MTNGFTDEDVLDRSPYLCSLKRKRLAPSRLAELLTAVSPTSLASRPAPPQLAALTPPRTLLQAKGSNRPSEPPLGECCGS